MDQANKTAGRPAILFICKTCKSEMSKKDVRTHKCAEAR